MTDAEIFEDLVRSNPTLTELFAVTTQEPDDCPYCNATGEGHYDGTTCQPCRGTGKQVGGGWDEDHYEEPEA